MENYLYKAVIYKEPDKIGNMDVTAETANRDDFVNNYLSQTLHVDDLELMSNVFLIEKTYADFKTLVDGSTVTWTNVRVEDGSWFYDLYILSENPL